MFEQKLILVLGIVLLAGALAGAQESPETADSLASVRALEGVWEGEGEGFGRTSTVTHEWDRVLGGKFMRLRTRSVTQGEDRVESVHEDVGYVSWSEGERILRFRQFLSEGFVNTFRLELVESPVPGFNFEPESTEGAENLVARMTLRFDRPDGYRMTLELGSEDQPLKACQTMGLNKIH